MEAAEEKKQDAPHPLHELRTMFKDLHCEWTMSPNAITAARMSTAEVALFMAERAFELLVKERDVLQNKAVELGQAFAAGKVAENKRLMATQAGIISDDITDATVDLASSTSGRNVCPTPVAECVVAQSELVQLQAGHALLVRYGKALTAHRSARLAHVFGGYKHATSTAFTDALQEEAAAHDAVVEYALSLVASQPTKNEKAGQ